MSISLSPPPPGRRARSLQRLAFSKYNNVQKWQGKFTLGSNAAKNKTDNDKIMKNNEGNIHFLL